MKENFEELYKRLKEIRIVTEKMSFEKCKDCPEKKEDTDDKYMWNCFRTKQSMNADICIRENIVEEEKTENSKQESTKDEKMIIGENRIKYKYGDRILDKMDHIFPDKEFWVDKICIECGKEVFHLDNWMYDNTDIKTNKAIYSVRIEPKYNEDGITCRKCLIKMFEENFKDLGNNLLAGTIMNRCPKCHGIKFSKLNHECTGMSFDCLNPYCDYTGYVV